MLAFIIVVAGVVYFAYRMIRHFEHEDLTSSKLGLASETKPLKTAIVLGGSIAGLVTAKCLSNHAEKVILIERKQMRDTKQSVAVHGNIIHVLLTRGCDIISRLFPGIEEKISPANNPDSFTFDFGSDLYWVAEGTRLTPLPPGVGVVSKQIQRFLFENLLREAIFATKNIEVIDDAKFLSYTSNESGRITGVVISKDDAQLPDGGKITADLVVDCMGLLSPTKDMLAKMGLANIESTNVHSHLQYVSQLYQQPEGVKHRNIYYQPYAPHKNVGAILMPYTKGVSALTFIGYNKAKLPREQKDIALAMEQFPEIKNYLSQCTPIGTATSYKKEGTELHHYEKANLDGLIALGDSMCNFNPVFGQGQSSAAEQVLVLDGLLQQLKQGERLNCQKFQERAKAVVSIPFALAAFSDLRYPKTETNSTTLRRFAPFVAFPLRKLLLDAATNSWSYRCFLKVLHMQQRYVWTFVDPKLMWTMLTQKN